MKRVERFRQRIAEGEVSPIRAELKVWSQAEGVIDALRDARPLLLDQLSDRQQDIGEPLLAIADMAGGDWPDRARAAIVTLCVTGTGDEESIGVKLLRDFRSIFEKRKADKLPTRDILEGLVSTDNDAPWAAWWEESLAHDKLKAPAQKLARLLKPYGIKPLKIRIGDETVQGYAKADFWEAWKRYLSCSPFSPETEQTEQTEHSLNCSECSECSDVSRARDGRLI